MELVHKTIGECLEERVAATPDAIAVEFNGDTLTWKQLDVLTDWLVLRFKFFGMKKGSRAALWCANCMQWIIVYFGLQKIGAQTILVNPGYLTEELYDVIEYSQIEFLFYGETFKNQSLTDIIDGMDLHRFPFIKQMVPIELDDAVRFMEEGAAKLTEADFEEAKRMEAEVTPDDVACILFTSGTTSTPKGVMLSHYNVINCARATVNAMRWTADDRFCIMVPMFHCFGMTSSMLASVICGSGLYLMTNTRSVNALEAIQKYRLTVINGVPSMFLAMIHNKALKDYDISSLKSGIIAGSKIRPDEYMQICSALGMEHLQMSYGQTETSPGVSFSPYDLPILDKSDNAGEMVENIELCIWTPSGQQYRYSEKQLQGGLAEGEEGYVPYNLHGEIGIRGYLVTRGYYNLPEATAKTIDPEGWIHTGDMGFLDEDRLLHVSGRLKEMIIRGGENISPTEIEECIQEIPGVHQVKVVGVPHPVLQEEISAMVSLEPGAALTAAEVQEYVRSHIAAYKVPKYVMFMEEIPQTSSGKIRLGDVKILMADFAEAQNLMNK